MIKKELRIGNWVYNGTQLIQITPEFFGQKEEGVTPIPLTEQILESFGSEKLDRQDRWFHDDLDFEVEQQGKYFAFCIWDEECPSLTRFIMHCEHLHTFQNNFFALSGGKELEVVKWKNKEGVL